MGLIETMQPIQQYVTHTQRLWGFPLAGGLWPPSENRSKYSVIGCILCAYMHHQQNVHLILTGHFKGLEDFAFTF